MCGQASGTAAQWVRSEGKPQEAEGKAQKGQEPGAPDPHSRRPCSSPCRPSGPSQRRGHHGILGRLTTAAFVPCSLAVPRPCRRVISRRLPPAPNGCPSCLDGVLWASVCGSDSTEPSGLGGVLWCLPGPGAPVVGQAGAGGGWRMQKLKVLRDLVVVRTPGAGKGVGQEHRCSPVPPPPFGEPRHKEGLMGTLPSGIRGHRDRAQAKAGWCQRQVGPPPGPPDVAPAGAEAFTLGPRGVSPEGLGGRMPGGGWAAGGAGSALSSCVHQAAFPPRGIRTTVRTSSAGPPAPAPPAPSASGATPRPRGRPSTTAVQVLCARGFPDPGRRPASYCPPSLSSPCLTLHTW